MDRRKALKNMGWGLGYAVATPTLISIVQSCKSDTTAAWMPDFFTAQEGSVITHLVDILLPKTDTPSASEMKVHAFIDQFAAQIWEKEKQDMIKSSMGKFIEKALADSGKSKAEDLGPEDLEPVLAAALKNTREEEVAMFESIDSYQQSVASGQPATLDDRTSRFAFANNLRGMTIWGYKTTEYIGEQVLPYLPVPGEYIPCADLEQLTGGMAWSLETVNFE
jgi:uncharacterized membrane protein